MKTTITLTRLYKKEVVIEVNKDDLVGMTPEQIGESLMAHHDSDEDELFDEAELQPIEFQEEVRGIDADTDRYDIYDDNGKQIYGGHL